MTPLFSSSHHPRILFLATSLGCMAACSPAGDAQDPDGAATEGDAASGGSSASGDTGASNSSQSSDGSGATSSEDSSDASSSDSTSASDDGSSTTSAPVPGAFDDDFEGSGPLLDYVTDRAEVLPDVARLDGRYRAHLVENGQNQTMHYNEARGRIDAKLVSFPFDLVARNVGIGLPNDSQATPATGQDAVLFAGLEVHDTDFQSGNWSFLVVGHKGAMHNTIEGKNTVAHVSEVSDTGDATLPEGRADIRLVGDASGHLTAYWQLPGTTPDAWIPYRGTGELPGPQANFGDEVYVGLITYAGWTNGLPFVGTCDALESH